MYFKLCRRDAGRAARRPLLRVLGGLAALSFAASACGSSTPSTESTSSQSPSSQSLHLFKAGLSDTRRPALYPQALKDFRKIVSLSANRRYVMLAEFDIGYIYQREGLLEASARAYSSALAIDANFTSALYNLAVLETKPDPSKAASLYVRLLRIDPTAASVNFSYGLLLISTGRRTTGETYVAKALRLDPALKSRVPKGDMPSTTSKSTSTSSTTTATSVVG